MHDPWYHPEQRSLTTFASTHDPIENGHKLGYDTVYLVETSKDRNHIRARICVLLAQNASQEDGKRLLRRVSPLDAFFSWHERRSVSLSRHTHLMHMSLQGHSGPRPRA